MSFNSRYFKIFAVYFFLVSHIFATNRLDPKDWRFITQFCLDYIQKHLAEIDVFTNESGFYRIKIPLPLHFKKNVIDIRLNYWGMDSKNFWISENIHNHPNYFESKIIFGGYEHELYKISQRFDEKNKTISCTLRRNHENINTIISKKVAHLDSVQIKKENTEKVLVVDQTLIHRIIQFVPGTLSINVVFAEQSMKGNIYEVFFKEPSKPDHPINTRAKIAGKKVKKAILLDILHTLIKSSKNETV